MKVLVTGGCGFLGANICLFYRDQGAEVVAFDNLAKHEFSRNPYMKPEARDYNKNLLESAGVKVVVEDIRNFEALLDFSQGRDYLVHTAAQPAMTISWEDPVLDFSSNTLGTFHVLETARKLKIPAAICSSIHTFGPDRINASLQEDTTRYTREPVEIGDDEPLLQGVVTPLHASKRSNEIYTQCYIDTYDLKVACFRLSGIYGPYQFGGEDHGWVANFAIRTVIGEPLTIFGTGKQLRDILYAADVAEAFDSFYRRQVPGIYTLGGGKENMISLIESIDMIKEITGRRPSVQFDKARFGDLKYFVTDYSRFHQSTGWRPRVRPAAGIANLIAWVKDNEELFYKKN
jgi:CDP-paratose 2-epimerase